MFRLSIVRAFGASVLVSLLAAVPVSATHDNPCDEPGDIPDVIVGDIPSIQRYGQFNGITAYSIGTTSCNTGTCWLDWFQESVRHPVISQNMYRLKGGRFEQIGQSWLKHGFAALSGSVCSPFCISTSGTHLGVNCSDPYSSSLNGSQGNLGPKHEVNPATGAFVWPFTTRGQTGNVIYKRLQVRNTDLSPALNAGAQYFAESTYLFPDDAPLPDNSPDSNMDGVDDFDQVDNSANNTSYRPMTITESTPGTFNASFTGPTVRELPALYAWRAADPGVVIKEARTLGDGRFFVGSRATDLGNGWWHYEYAVFNQTSRDAARSFSVPIPFGANLANIGFHDVDYHSQSTDGSGSIYDGTDWQHNNAQGFMLTWSTATFAENPNANALRWGTLYNFRFDADVPPGQAGATLEPFLGTGGGLRVSAVAPTTCDLDGVCDPGEDCANCPADCANQGGGGGCCGDGTCNPGETSCSCLRDCGPPDALEFVCNDGGDGDCDGRIDCADSDCCSAAACAGADNDMDGFELCDCDDANPNAWSLPGEVEALNLAHDRGTGTTTLSWLAPLDPGASSVSYEVLRSSNATNFLSSTTCLADPDPTDTLAVDLAPASVANVFHYLVRAVNGCPGGDGLLGRNSSNTPIGGRVCP